MEKLKNLSREILGCEKCPRLRAHCLEIARVKKPQFKDEPYLGLPVPGFGDENARLLMVGLAPAAHGGNRTGRMFTGDNSGLWLYRALYRAGFSNQEQSTSRDDSLRLRDAYVTAVARCAPPLNKLEADEILNCRSYLKRELQHFLNIKVYLVFGQVALKGLWAILPKEVKPSLGAPKFSHGMEMKLLDGKTLLCSFHPSQQNTFTKKLTEPMFDSIFKRAKNLLQRG